MARDFRCQGPVFWLTGASRTTTTGARGPLASGLHVGETAAHRHDEAAPAFRASASARNSIFVRVPLRKLYASRDASNGGTMCVQACKLGPCGRLNHRTESPLVSRDRYYQAMKGQQLARRNRRCRPALLKSAGLARAGGDPRQEGLARPGFSFGGVAAGTSSLRGGA